MTKGPNRLVLDRYLDTAQEDTLQWAGSDWKKKAAALKILAQAMQAGAEQAELHIGEQTLTGPALRKGMEDSATSISDKSDQLHAAGEALVQVGRQIGDTREARDLMKDLGEKPSPYQPPAGTPGVPLTTAEINAQAADSQARQTERTNWQDAFDKQEARSLTLTKQMDAAFLGAIPPMQAIHGQDDPTEPPPSVPSGPGGPLLPGTQVPGGGDGNDDTKTTTGKQWDSEIRGPKDDDNDNDKDKDRDRDPEQQPEQETPVYVHEGPGLTQLDPIRHGPQQTPTTSVIGASQTGITYSPGGGSVAAPVSASASPGMSTGAAMGAAGMAGGAGAASMSGAVRGGSVPAPSGRSAGAPARAIGSTGRSASSGALSRSAGSAGSPAARSAAAGGASGTRAGAAGSAAGRGGAAGGAGARGAGSRGAVGSAAGGRGGRKGDRDAPTDRDSLVYDQDWLGDDEVAPGVLD